MPTGQFVHRNAPVPENISAGQPSHRPVVSSSSTNIFSVGHGPITHLAPRSCSPTGQGAHLVTTPPALVVSTGQNSHLFASVSRNCRALHDRQKSSSARKVSSGHIIATHEPQNRHVSNWLDPIRLRNPGAQFVRGDTHVCLRLFAISPPRHGVHFLRARFRRDRPGWALRAACSSGTFCK